MPQVLAPGTNREAWAASGASEDGGGGAIGVLTHDEIRVVRQLTSRFGAANVAKLAEVLV